MTVTPDISVEQVNQLAAKLLTQPGGAFQAQARRELAKDGPYAGFVQQFYEDLDVCINGVRTIKDKVQDDGEDRLTADLVLQLSRFGYITSHDKAAGGHIDIGVEHGPHTWIGEAKLDWSIDEGLKQLTTRYVSLSGDPKHDHGGLLFYLKRTEDCKQVMDKWRAGLEAASTVCRDCPANPLAFFSEIKLKGTGLPFHVRAILVSLHHEPQDKSGVKTRANRAARVKSKSVSPR